MLITNSTRLFQFIALFWTSLGLINFLGCTTAREIADLRLYYDQEIQVVAADGARYRLEKDWTSDSLGNISGTGTVWTRRKQLKPFKGTVPAKNVTALRYWEYDKTKTYLLIATISIQVGGIVAAIIGSKH
ncbi:MAG: hypothetical protein WBD36_10100 [Bacteroidota bacterium]